MMRFLTDLLVLLTFLPCLKGGRSFVIEPKSWDYRGHEIGYEVSRRALTSSNTNNFNETARGTPSSSSSSSSSFHDSDKRSNKEPIVLLNGFGVGSFHQHRLKKCLHDHDDDDDGNGGDNSGRVVYGIDYLGQGRSWPRDCDDGRSDNEQGLRYSADMWVDQIIQFIEEVVLLDHRDDDDDDDDVKSAPPTKVHLVGNSVGGHLAAHIAMRRPDLVASICLLNPTPVWGLNLPGWSGHLPAPAIPKAIGRYLFDRIRDLNTIEKYLQNAYARSEAFKGTELMNQIRGCTLGAGGHAAFASILFSPPLEVSLDDDNDRHHLPDGSSSSSIKKKGSKSFEDCLARVPCDVLLVFGKDDPWCKPAFAKTMLQALQTRRESFSTTISKNKRPQHRYIELENCGHCPNHEAPQAVASVVRAWVDATDRSAEHLQFIETGNAQHQVVFSEPWGEVVMRERKESDIQLGWMDRLATTFV